MSSQATARDWIIGIAAAAFFPSLLAFGILLRIFPCMITDNRACVEKRLGPHAAQYACMANLPEDPGEGYVAGKLVVVNTGESVRAREGVDYAPNKLNLDIHVLAPDRAYAPQDVGTVILLRWWRVQMGAYEGGVIAWKANCEVMVIDKQRQLVVARKRFEGGDPPNSFYYSQRMGIPSENRKFGLSGSLPITEISRYIAGLPRR